jgi:SPOR domain
MAMTTDTDKYEAQIEREAPHSAFQEFGRDERRPAVILLSALLLAAIFFAIGIMFGRWTAERGSQPPAVAAPAASTQTPPPTPPAVAGAPQQNATAQPTATPQRATERRYTLLIADLKTKEAANSLAQSLERAGYKDVRVQTGSNVNASTLTVMIGRYTRDEAEAEAARLKKQGGPRTKNVRVVEAPAG